MRRPFEEVQQSINNDLDQLSIIGIVLVSAFSVAFLVLACKLSLLLVWCGLSLVANKMANSSFLR